MLGEIWSGVEEEKKCQDSNLVLQYSSSLYKPCCRPYSYSFFKVYILQTVTGNGGEGLKSSEKWNVGGNEGIERWRRSTWGGEGVLP